MEDNSIEERKEIIDIVGKYGEYLNKHAPQIEENNMNYYFAGSLAMMLYASASKMEYCNLKGDKIVNNDNEKDITKETRENLTLTARKMGDLDIIQIGKKGLYRDLKNPIKEYYGDGIKYYYIDRNKPLLENGKYVRKEIPNIDKMSDKTLQGLFGPDATGGELNGNVMRDRVCKLTLTDGKTVYVASPETIISHKLNRITKYYGDYEDESKDIKDVILFVNGISNIYDEEEISQRVSEAWLEQKGRVDLKGKKSAMIALIDQSENILKKEGIENTKKVINIFKGSMVKFAKSNKKQQYEKPKSQFYKETGKVSINGNVRNVNEVIEEIKDSEQNVRGDKNISTGSFSTHDEAPRWRK